MHYILSAAPLVVLLLGIYATSLYGYLLFHGLAEVFSVVIAFGIFMVVWNARKLLQNHFLLFVGIAYLYIGGIELLHTLSFKGMGVFEGRGANLPTQLWIAARYLESLSLLLATIFLHRKLSPRPTFAAYGLVVGLLLLSIFSWGVFPVCYVEGVGLTPFKISSEYVICLVLLVAIGRLILNSKDFDRKVLILLVASIATAVVQELAFTTYLSVYGPSNLIGHLLKIVSFYLLYKAIIETSLVSPYDALFRSLKLSEAKFRGIFETNVVPIAYCHVDGRILDANDAYLGLLGFTREELRRGEVRWDMATPPEWRSVDDKALELLRRDRVCSPMEKEYLRRDGTRVPVLIGACLVSGDSGQVVAFALDMTERKQAERLIRQSEARYRELVQNANSAIIRWRANGKIAFFNEYAQSFFGYGAGEIIGRHVSILVPDFESTGGDLRALAKDVVDHPERYVQSINENICRDGRRVWMAWTNKPVLDNQGRVTEILAVGTDITERKRAEAALRTSNERLELLAAVAERLLRSEAPQVIVEEICRMVMAHLDCQFFFNYLVETPGERLRLNACAGIPDEAAAAIRDLGFGVAVCGCVAQEGQRITAQFIQESDDPRTQLVKSYGVQAYCCHPLMAQGRLIGTLSFGTRTRPMFTSDEVAVMKSVADQVAVAMQRLQAGQAIRESEEQYRLLFAANPNPMFVFDEETLQFFAVNDAAVDHYGWSREEFLSMQVLDIRPPEDRDWAMDSIRRHLGAKETSVGPVRHLKKDGTLAEMELTVSSITFAGRPGHLCSMKDITERKRTEEALRKAHAQLQDHALQLEETNRELEGFAYTISHDLRAPLRAINGFAHMLEDDYGPSLGEEGKRQLAVIGTNAVKMGMLIDDLLAFSRAGRTAMNISRIDMERLLAEVLETLKTSDAGARINVQVAPLPPAQGDPVLIRQVLANLIENAVKFSSHRPDPRIEVGSLEQEGERLYFVKDNGVGFDMKYYDKLFGVFQRLVTEKEFEGTGVGLAIVHRLVTRHGGRVWAESRPGEGATFFFTLNRKQF